MYAAETVGLFIIKLYPRPALFGNSHRQNRCQAKVNSYTLRNGGYLTIKAEMKPDAVMHVRSERHVQSYFSEV